MTFHAKASTIGNSKGLRLDAALYKEHPEFSTGGFTVDVIATGRMLIRTETPSSADETADPVFDAFLGFLEENMAAQPNLISPMRLSEARRVRELIGGIKIDDDEVFGESFTLP